MNFAEYCNTLGGRSGIVVGKGPTEYDYQRLGEDALKDKATVLFINDAVQLEKHLPADAPESFQFFLDDHQAVHWLNQTKQRSTRVAKASQRHHARQPNAAVWYDDTTQFPLVTRRELAGMGKLYRFDGVGGGTICPLLHWCWYIGLRQIRFIGCDGINRKDVVRKLTGGADYDQRLALPAGGKSGWKYDSIRRNQNMLCELFGFETEYVGSPPAPERSPVLYVSAGTPSYKDLLDKLRETAVTVGVELYTEFLTDRGDWALNCAQKPEFLSKMQQVWPNRRLVWVDADAQFRRKPSLVEDLPCNVDVAVSKRGNEVLSGTVYLGDGDGARELVARWCNEQRKAPADWDQKTLVRAMQSSHAVVQVLPPEYTFIFDISRKEHPGLDPVIEHMQASRSRK